HGRCGEVTRDLVVRDASGDLDVLPSLELASKRTVTDEDEAALAELCERVGQPNDVLALDQAPDADEHRSVPALSGARHRTCLEEREVDPRVDDLGLAARLGDLGLELAAQVVGNSDQRRSPAGDEACGGPDAG